MGEYATYRGESIKIGTCESMYYLRADQRGLIGGYQFDGSERFRFPFPDEDTIEPGHFDDYDRGVRIPDWTLPDAFTGHGSLQFKHERGYLLSLDCPEGEHATHTPHDYGLASQFKPSRDTTVSGLHVGRNGWNGQPVVRQQKVVGGLLVTVVACGACDAAWRLETIEEARPVIEAFRTEADAWEFRRDVNGWGPKHSDSYRAFLVAMADRIEQGYNPADPDPGDVLASCKATA